MSTTDRPIARPPEGFEAGVNVFFRWLTFAFAWVTLLAVALIVWQMGVAAAPAVQKYGVGFLGSSAWNDSKEQFGIAAEIWGTLYSSILGVALGSLFGVAVAVFLTEQFLPPAVEIVCKNVIELLAAIPSVVYGLWGIFVVIPAIRPWANWVHGHLGWIPVFDTPLVGPGLLPAALVLAIMVLPTVTAVSRDALASVPRGLREASFGLGATRWETILAVVLPTAARGIYGAIILAFGRATGETMALAMLVGNVNQMKWSVFAPADTLASLIANRFPEASRPEQGALMYAGLVLLAITLVINVLGTWVVQRSTVKVEGGTAK